MDYIAFRGPLVILYLCSLLAVDAGIKKSEIVDSQSFVRKEQFDQLDELQFTVFGKLFVLTLQPKLFNTQGNCILTHFENGIKKDLRVHESGFEHYVGEVKGDGKSYVDLMHLSKQYYGTIELEKENIIFEPESFYNSEAAEGSVIFHLVDKPPLFSSKEPTPARVPRSTSSQDEPVKKNRCGVNVVVDYSFVRKYNTHNNIYGYVLSMMEKVNDIFKKTDFDMGATDAERENRGRFIGMGMQIISIVILPPNKTNANHFSYSGEKEWILKSLEESFRSSEYCNASKTCLCHLITGKTFQKDERDKYGCAPVATLTRGICTRENTLITRAPNKYVNLSVLKSFLVAAHEYGHAWGANHTADITLMSKLQVDGFHESHKTFSYESIAQIRNTLNSNWGCFVESSASFCGNYIVEANEQCDHGKNEDSQCCTKDCMLPRNAVCSPINHVCCNENCQFAGKEKKCSDAVPEICEDASYCSDSNMFCPDPELLNNTICYGNGTCLNGICVPFCTMNGMEECVCEGQDACRLCCQAEGEKCTPQKDMYVPDGKSCGKRKFCQNGECQLLNSSVSSIIVYSGYGVSITTAIVMSFTLIFCSIAGCVHKYDELQLNYKPPTPREYGTQSLQ